MTVGDETPHSDRRRRDARRLAPRRYQWEADAGAGSGTVAGGAEGGRYTYRLPRDQEAAAATRQPRAAKSNAVCRPEENGTAMR